MALVSPRLSKNVRCVFVVIYYTSLASFSACGKFFSRSADLRATRRAAVTYYPARCADLLAPPSVDAQVIQAIAAGQ